MKTGGQIPIEKHYHSLDAKNEVEFNCQPQTMEVTNRILTVLKRQWSVVHRGVLSYQRGVGVTRPFEC